MVKAIMCDICGEGIKLKEGNLFTLEIRKITEGIEGYPGDYSADGVVDRDYCKKCIKKVGFLLGFKELTGGKSPK